MDYYSKYIKYKSKYINLLNQKKLIKGGKPCRVGEEFNSEISRLFRILQNSIENFFIFPNSTMFRTTMYFFDKSKISEVSINIMKRLLIELQTYFINDPSYSAKRSMVELIIQEFRDLIKCFNKEYTTTDLLVAINYEDNINGRRLRVPPVKFKSMEEVTLGYFEKLLWWGCGIKCNNNNYSPLSPLTPLDNLYSPLSPLNQYVLQNNIPSYTQRSIYDEKIDWDDVDLELDELYEKKKKKRKSKKRKSKKRKSKKRKSKKRKSKKKSKKRK